MRLRYIGEHEGIEIPALGVVVAQGEEFEVTGDIAQELLKRGDWERLDKPTKGEA